VGLDHLFDPGRLAGRVDVVRAGLGAGFDHGRRVQVIWPDGVDEYAGFLGKGKKFRGGELVDGDDCWWRAGGVEGLQVAGEGVEFGLRASGDGPFDVSWQVGCDVLGA
jgi:hypothetical protein